jgi:hypothetical protein
LSGMFQEIFINRSSINIIFDLLDLIGSNGLKDKDNGS